MTLHLGLGRDASPALLCLGPSIRAWGSPWDPLGLQRSARERRALGRGEPWRRAGRQAAGGAQRSRALTERLAPPGPARLSRHPAPAGPDPRTRRPVRASPLSCRCGGGRGAARRGRIPAARAGGVAEPSQPDAPGLPTPAGTCLGPHLLARPRHFSRRPLNFIVPFPILCSSSPQWFSGYGCKICLGTLHPAGCLASSSSSSPGAGVRRRWSSDSACCASCGLPEPSVGLFGRLGQGARTSFGG